MPTEINNFGQHVFLQSLGVLNLIQYRPWCFELNSNYFIACTNKLNK